MRLQVVLGDPLNGEVASFTVGVGELPSAGERLWELASRFHSFGPTKAEPLEGGKVVPLSKVLARTVAEDAFPVLEISPALLDADVLSYAVRRANERFETIWYTNAPGEVREEAMPCREPWRQSKRSRMAEGFAAAIFARPW